jgi:hypothetical protein
MITTTCDRCGAVIGEEHCRVHRERETFWGAPCSYPVIAAYVCPECGYEWEA